MGVPSKRPRPLWIRTNPRRLPSAELAEVRQGPHLADLKLPKTMFRALIRAGHRWARELAYVKLEDARGHAWVDRREYYALVNALAEHGITIGSLVRERVYFPI